MSRRRTAAIVVIAVILSAVGGWAVASRIRSPAEIAARTAPPEASPILIPVEERVLSSDVVTRGTARYGSPQQLTVVASALKVEPGVVTTAPAPGAELNEGDVVMTAANRPVFLVAGDRLGVRDLGPGLEGEDVRQFEETLARLGFDPGPIDGVYDSATESGVAAWYRDAGFAPFEATEDQLSSIPAREADLASARADLHTARTEVATAEADLAAAEAAHADALNAQNASGAAVAAAAAEAQASQQAAYSEVLAKAASVDELRRSGASGSEIAAAEAELQAAQAQVFAARSTGEAQIADASATAAAADNEVATTEVARRAAEETVANARATARDQGAFADLAAQEAGLERRRAGIQVPADELVLARTTPVRVNELLVQVGDQLSGAVLSVTDARVAIDGSLRLEDAALVEVGMPVQIAEADLGIEATGTISQIAQTPGTNGVDGFHIWFEVAVEQPPPNLVGASVRLTVAVESSGGAVLAVPNSAVSLAADGSSRVERDGRDGTTFVTVEPGLSADGYVEVTPLDGSLEPGDMVVVGVELSKRSGNG